MLILLFYNMWGLNCNRANFVNNGNPWFRRGGNFNNGSASGVFAFNHDNGNANGNISFRSVLARLRYVCITELDYVQPHNSKVCIIEV